MNAFDEDRVAERLRSEYGSVLAAVEDAADRAAATWPTPRVEDGGLVRSSFRQALAEREVRDQLPALLESVVGRLDASMTATPVPAPPYVVVTSEGVLLRATTDRGRILVSLQVFDHEHGRYERLADVAVSVRIR